MLPTENANLRSAINASFQVSLWSCQTPSDDRNIAETTASVRNPAGERREASSLIIDVAKIPEMIRYQNRLHQPQADHREENDHRRPDDDMDPHRRCSHNLKPQRQGHNQKAEKEDSEYRRAVAGIVGGQIEAADAAVFGD